jgi:hypothetical protein
LETKVINLVSIKLHVYDQSNNLDRKNTMKTFQQLIATLLILLVASCSSTQQAGSSNPDDVYYSSKDRNQAPAQQQPVAQPSASDYSTNNSNDQQQTDNNQSSERNADYYDSNKTTDGSGTTYITNNYYDDYYDYEYSSRLRRYYTPAYGYGYYDPFYTNMYWYDYNPYSWGVSIYLGYNWWAPSYYYYSPFCYGGFYNPWYSPYGGYYGAYGYYPGAYGYYNPYYYNSYDGTGSGYYYGPRTSISSNTRTGMGSRDDLSSRIASGKPAKTIGDKYVAAVSSGQIIPSIKTNDTRNSTGKMQDLNTGRNNIDNVSGGVKNSNTKTNSASPSHDIKSDAVNTGNGSIKSGESSSPTKGIITRKNETMNPENIQNNQVPANTNPGYQNTIRNNSNINHNQPGKNPNQNINPRSTQPDPRMNGNSSQPPRQNEIREQQEYSAPKNDQRNDGQIQPPSQPAPQNTEPRRPRQMSNAEPRRSESHPSFHIENPSSSGRSSGGSYSAPSSSRGNNSSGGSRGSGGGRGRK